MANTIIQIKRSLTTAQPTSLSVGELGYSYQSNTAFIGTPDGTGVVAIGGKAYLDLINTAFTIANAAYGAANGAGSLAVINLIFGTANAAYDKANAANVLAYNTGIGANAYATEVGTSGNAYATAVGTSGNAYATAVGTSGNAYATAVGTSGNAYSNVIGAASNTWANTVGTAGNAYADVVGTSANNYSNATFVKLTAGSQTITGDLAITGNLIFTGNAVVISANTLEVGDSLIYLAANNYSGTDTLPIGLIANYGNATSQNVHTGFVRNPANKEYYLFNGYDLEPGTNNQINFGANGMTTAVLNADLVTNNLWLGGANAIVWIKSAYDNSNGAFDKANAANVLAYNTGIGANAYADTVGTAGNAYAVTVGTSSNNYAGVMANSVNAYTSATYSVIGHGHAPIFAAANQAGVIANAAFDKANNVAISANSYSNTLNTVIFQTFSDAANITSGTLSSSRLSGSYTGITGVGTITTGTWHGSTVNVGYGGTGIVSATLNGVLFGGGGNAAFQVTAAGTEGQVLTASATGVPQFEMLSGGTF